MSDILRKRARHPNLRRSRLSANNGSPSVEVGLDVMSEDNSETNPIRTYEMSPGGASGTSQNSRHFEVKIEKGGKKIMSEEEVSTLVHNALRRAREATSSVNPRRRSVVNMGSASAPMSPNSEVSAASSGLRSVGSRPPQSPSKAAFSSKDEETRSNSSFSPRKTSRIPAYSPRYANASPNNSTARSSPKPTIESRQASSSDDENKRPTPGDSFSFTDTDDMEIIDGISVDEADYRGQVDLTIPSITSVNSSDAIIRRVEEEIANARRAAQEANRRLAGVSAGMHLNIQAAPSAVSEGMHSAVIHEGISISPDPQGDDKYQNAIEVVGSDFQSGKHTPESRRKVEEIIGKTTPKSNDHLLMPEPEETRRTSPHYVIDVAPDDTRGAVSGDRYVPKPKSGGQESYYSRTTMDSHQGLLQDNAIYAGPDDEANGADKYSPGADDKYSTAEIIIVHSDEEPSTNAVTAAEWVEVMEESLTESAKPSTPRESKVKDPTNDNVPYEDRIPRDTIQKKESKPFKFPGRSRLISSGSGIASSEEEEELAHEIVDLTNVESASPAPSDVPTQNVELRPTFTDSFKSVESEGEQLDTDVSFQTACSEDGNSHADGEEPKVSTQGIQMPPSAFVGEKRSDENEEKKEEEADVAQVEEKATDEDDEDDDDIWKNASQAHSTDDEEAPAHPSEQKVEQEPLTLNEDEELDVAQVKAVPKDEDGDIQNKAGQEESDGAQVYYFGVDDDDVDNNLKNFSQKYSTDDEDSHPEQEQATSKAMHVEVSMENGDEAAEVEIDDMVLHELLADSTADDDNEAENEDADITKDLDTRVEDDPKTGTVEPEGDTAAVAGDKVHEGSQAAISKESAVPVDNVHKGSSTTISKVGAVAEDNVHKGSKATISKVGSVAGDNVHKGSQATISMAGSAMSSFWWNKVELKETKRQEVVKASAQPYASASSSLVGGTSRKSTTEKSSEVIEQTPKTEDDEQCSGTEVDGAADRATTEKSSESIQAAKEQKIEDMTVQTVAEGSPGSDQLSSQQPVESSIEGASVRVDGEQSSEKKTKPELPTELNKQEPQDKHEQSKTTKQEVFKVDPPKMAHGTLGQQEQQTPTHGRVDAKSSLESLAKRNDDEGKGAPISKQPQDTESSGGANLDRDIKNNKGAAKQEQDTKVVAVEKPPRAPSPVAHRSSPFRESISKQPQRSASPQRRPLPCSPSPRRSRSPAPRPPSPPAEIEQPRNISPRPSKAALPPASPQSSPRTIPRRRSQSPAPRAPHPQRVAMVEHRRAVRDRDNEARAAIGGELGVDDSKPTDVTGITTDRSKKVRFRQRYPVPPMIAKPSAPSDIVKRNEAAAPDTNLILVKPKPELKALLDAVADSSRQRRSNACGALKVLSTQKKNRLTLVRTERFLDALVFAASVDLCKKERETSKDARSRAVDSILNVAEPKDNRAIVFNHPGLADALVKCIVENAGDSRAGACAALATLAKTPYCRAPMAEVTGLLDILATVLRGSKDKERNEEEVEYGGDDEASERDGLKSFSSDSHSTTSSSSSTTSYQSDEEIDELRSVKSMRQQKIQLNEEISKRARLSACAALVHLSKSCAVTAMLCANEKVMNALVLVSREYDNPIHTKCLEILCNMTRFPHNNARMALYSGLVDTLVVSGRAKVDEDRVWSLRTLQNLSSDSTGKNVMANNIVLELLSVSVMRNHPDEQVAATATLYNLSTEPGAVVPLTNTKNVVATLVHVAHSPDSSPGVRLMACDALATLGLWLQTLAGAGVVPDGVQAAPLPSYATAGWQRWD